MWAVLTDQNEDEFILKINPKITRLVVEHYLKTKQLGVTDDYAYEKPELAFDFLADLFNILVEEIFPEKQAIIGEKILRLLSSDSTTIIPDDEVLLEASTLATFDAVTQINERLSAEPLLKERLNQPVLAEILTMEAKAYGWDEVTSSDNVPKLQSTLSQAGCQTDKRTMSRSLKSLARKNPLQTIKDALNDNLMKNIINRISEIKLKADRIETSFEFPSDSEVDNTQVRKWIFRRS